MARKSLKRAIINYLPKGFEKAIFALVSGLCMILMYTCWLPMATYAFWAISNQWLYYGVIGLNFLVNYILMKAMNTMQDADLHGVKIAKERMEGKEMSSSDEKLPKKVVRTGFYGIVRHPQMFLQMLIQWVSPTMTAGHALWSGILTAYIVIGITFFEEPALVEEFGEDYKQYMKEVPRFIPDPRRLFDSNKKD
jgi:protein-S-isoprenylcysteine O-methyltransferase Ste14